MADKPKRGSEYKPEQVEIDAVGPMRVAAFVTGGRDDELQADVVAFVDQLIAKVGADVLRMLRARVDEVRSVANALREGVHGPAS
jgi:hypothetical protein